MATTYDPTTADAGAIVAVPAENLVIDPNVRRDIARDTSFVSSIRQYGILQPPVGWQDEDGLVHIVMGQRRTSAALEIGHPVVHVLVKSKRVAQDEQAAEAARIVEQLAENDHRAELSTADRAAAFQQLALFGMTEERIARKTNTPRAVVATSLSVAQSKAASDTAEAHSLNLEQAAIIAEFDADADARERLEQQAAEDPAQLEHLAQRLREERLDEEARNLLIARVRELGAELADEWPGNDLTSTMYLYREDAAGERKYIAEEDLPELEGVVGYVKQGWRGDGNRGFTITWYVKDPASQGILGARGRSQGAELTEEEKTEKKEQARLKRERKKAFQAATVVRREWIRSSLLSRHTRFNESHFAWIAGALLGAVGHLRDGRVSDLAFDLLGHENTIPSHEKVVETQAYSSPTSIHARRVIRVDRAQRVALAAAVAQTEVIVGNEKGDDFGADPRASIYLAQLRDWGYALSDVERAIVEAMDARVDAAFATAEESDDTDADTTDGEVSA